MDALLKQPVLETARLSLRPTVASDTGLISLYTSDLRVARMTTSIPHPNPPGAVEAFLRMAQSDTGDFNWTIDATRGFGCNVVGAIGLDKDGAVGYWLGPFFWGLGIATEAVGTVCQFARKSNYPRLSAGVFQENPASRRVLEKNGFVLDREGQSFCVAQDRTVETWEMIDGSR